MLIKDEILKYINIENVLRYLNYKGQTPDSQTLMLVEMTMTETLQLAAFKHHTHAFQMKIENEQILYKADNMTTYASIDSYDLSEFLEGSDALIIVGVTLGFELTRKIHQLMLTEPTKGVIMDACASVVADAYCDQIQDHLTEHHTRLNRYCSGRFSPGYGDLDLKYQTVFANYLHLSKRIGVHTTTHNQLNPEKSVIFVMGTSSRPFTSETRTCESNCLSCKMKWCQFRRENNG